MSRHDLRDVGPRGACVRSHAWVAYACTRPAAAGEQPAGEEGTRHPLLTMEPLLMGLLAGYSLAGAAESACPRSAQAPSHQLRNHSAVSVRPLQISNHIPENCLDFNITWCQTGLFVPGQDSSFETLHLTSQFEPGGPAAECIRDCPSGSCEAAAPRCPSADGWASHPAEQK